MESTAALSSNRRLAGLAGWLLLCFAVSAIGALASIQAQTFYAQLVQPDWAPPGYVFGPVWTILYAMMAIAAWLVWCKGGFKENRLALSLFLAQLAVNALWCWLFFAWFLGALAFADILLLWLLIATTLWAFWRRRLLAGMLMLPYLFWVSFAAMLNLSVWQLNPRLLG